MAEAPTNVIDFPVDLAVAGPKAKQDYGDKPSFHDPGVKNITPDILAVKFSRLFRDADDFRKVAARDWMSQYAQYNALPTDRAKESWQNNVFIPLASRAVDVAAGKVTKDMFKGEDILEISPDAAADDILCRTAKKITKWGIRKTKASMGPVKEAVKDGLICGNGWLKLHYAETLEPRSTAVWQDPKPFNMLGETFTPTGGKYVFKDTFVRVRKLRMESPIPTNMWVDPTGQNRFIIQRIPRALSDIWGMAHPLRDPVSGEVFRPAIYDPTEVAKVRPGTYDSERQQNEATIRKDQANIMGGRPYRGVDLYEFYGDFPDPDTGVILYRNVLITFADVRWTLRMPERMPFRHGMPPYVRFSAKIAPHQVYGQGLLTNNVKIQEAYNRHWNVVLDKALLQVPALEYDPTHAAEPRALMGDRPTWKTGKMWKRRPGLPSDRKIFLPVTGFPEVTQQDLTVLNMLKNAYDGDTAVNEFATGTQTSFNRKTKEEVEARTQATEEIFNDIAVHMEETAIGPLLKQIYYLIVQYEDKFDSPDLMRAFGDDPEAMGLLQQIQAMTPEERWAKMFLDAEFRAVGITNQITKQERLDNIHAFKQDLMSDPMLSVLLNKQEELRTMLELYDQPAKMLADNWTVVAQAMTQGGINQLMNPQPPPGGPGGAPPGAGGPPGGGGGPGPQAPNTHNRMAALQGEASRAPKKPSGPK